MRLPFPDHISLVAVCFFAGTLCVIQLLQGTNPTFALFAATYIVVAAIAFNTGGGFTRTPGAFVFFNSVLGVIIGLCMKAYLGEPADSNLQSPMLTRVSTSPAFARFWTGFPVSRYSSILRVATRRCARMTRTVCFFDAAA